MSNFLDLLGSGSSASSSVSAASSGAGSSSGPQPHLAFPHSPADGVAELDEVGAPATTLHSTLLDARGLTKNYRRSNHVIPVLRGVDFAVPAGSFTAIVGQSGSGKSTLLHLLGTLDKPDSGQIHFEGHRIDNLPREGHDLLRNKYFGMIFQFYHLLPELTMLENVLVPLMVQHGFWSYWRRRRQFVEQARHLLDIVGLSHREKHRPRELSGGEMQRTAIARALITGPKLLLADEPTGNLDHQTGEGILEILCNLNEQQNLTIVMVTHDSSIAEQAHRTVRLAEGLVQTA